MTTCLLALMLCGGGPTYPLPLYPPGGDAVGRRTEVPFAETEASARRGFNQAFPEFARQVIRVDDFGAVADGRTDCTPAFYRALDAARKTGQPSEIAFSKPGRYYLLPHPELGSDDLTILRARGLTNAVIRGQGPDTQLVAGDPKLGCLLVSDSTTVMVRDLTIDYNPLPFTQGTVTKVSAAEGSFWLRLHAGYPTPDAMLAAIPGSHSGYRMYRAAGLRWPVIGGLAIRSATAAGDGLWRLEADPAALQGYLSVGDDFVYVGRRIAQQALAASFVKSLWVRGVTVHASPTCGFGLANVDGALIERYADVLPPGSDRLLSSNADGLFVHGERGGITVRDSSFAGQGDDCINLHCPGLPGSAVEARGADLAIKAELDLRVGDSIEIMNPADNQLRGVAKVVEVAPRQAALTRCRVDRPLAELGYDPATDELYPVELSASNFKIVNNHFGQNRSRCLLIQARDGLIAGNTGENAEGYGVILSYGGRAWHEGVVPARVTITHNLFRNVTGCGMAGVIEASGGAGRLLRDLQVTDNRFVNPRKMVLCASGVDGLLFARNLATTEAGRRMTWNHPEWYPFDCSVYLVDCSRVAVEDYQLTDPDLRDAGVHIAKDCAPGAEGVALSRLSFTLGHGVPPVRDLR